MIIELRQTIGHPYSHVGDYKRDQTNNKVLEPIISGIFRDKTMEDQIMYMNKMNPSAN